jgi:hypothetical protein
MALMSWEIPLQITWAPKNAANQHSIPFTICKSFLQSTPLHNLRRRHVTTTVYDAAAGTVYAAAQSLISPQLQPTLPSRRCYSLRHRHRYSLCRYMHSLRRHHTTATVYAVAAATVYPEGGTKTAAAEGINNAAAASGSDIGGPYGQGLPP